MGRPEKQKEGRFIFLNKTLLYYFYDAEVQLKRKQRRVLKRLFRYSRPDWPWITIGTILLLGAAICKYYSI